jgi:hypothetical protein
MTESLSVKQKSRRLDFAWFGGGLTLGLGALFLSMYFIIPLLLLFAVVVVLSLTWVRCPKCKKSARVRELRIGRIKLPVPQGFTEKRCSRCGADL